MSKRVRLIDIAERLNITKVSVSKALRDHPDISRETRELVKKTADEMGYSPNLLARSLSSRKSLTLGVVVPKIAHTFFASVIDAIQSEATEAGYGIVLAVSNETAELEGRHIERLLSMRVDGLLVSVSKQEADLSIYQRVQEMKVPLVFFDRSLADLEFSSVTVDDRRGAFEATEALIKNGCRRIAHIGGTPEVEIGRERQGGFEDAMRKHGVPINPEWIIPGGFDEWHGYNAFQEILRSGETPDAVFAATFPTALGVHGALRKHAPELIEEIEIASFGEAGENRFYGFPHICVQQPVDEIGRTAVQLLLEQVEDDGSDWAPQNVVLTTKLFPSAADYARLKEGAVS